MRPFELFITSVHHLRTYYPSMYHYTIACVTCIYILGQAHVCGALTKLNVLLTSLWPLLSTGMKVRMDIFCVDIVSEHVSRVNHLASDNTPFDS